MNRSQLNRNGTTETYIDFTSETKGKGSNVSAVSAQKAFDLLTVNSKLWPKSLSFSLNFFF